MGYCGNCGRPLQDESGFCSYCGTEHSEDGEVALPGRAVDGPAAEDMALPVAPTKSAPPSQEQVQTVRQERSGESSADSTSSASAAGAAAGSGRSPKALWVALAVLAIVAAVGATVAVMALRGSGGADEPAVAQPASPDPLPVATVKIVSPGNGNKVIGGQAVRVAVVATGVSDLQGLRLTVDGLPAGQMKPGTGPDESKTAWFAWRPPEKGGDATLRVEAVLTDGSIIPSRTIRVVVRSAEVPVPAQPSYDSGGDSGATPQGGFWAVFFNASRSRSGAEAAAAEARAKGFDNAHVLYTPDYSSLNQDSWYAAYLGPFGSKSEAEAADGNLSSSGFEGAYAKAVN